MSHERHSMIKVQHSNHSNMVRQGILPEPFPKMGGGYSVVFTTPYVIVLQDCVKKGPPCQPNDGYMPPLSPRCRII